MDEFHPVAGISYMKSRAFFLFIPQVLSRCANGRTRTAMMARNAAATTVNRLMWGPARDAYVARLTSPATRTSTATNTSSAAGSSGAARHFGEFAPKEVTAANPSTFADPRKAFTIDCV